METPDLAALWFLLPALPISAWVAWSDLSRMKIPNKAVLALMVAFLVIGPFVLPLAEYGWRWTHFVVMLLVGMGLNAAGVFGAGDAKFIAAAAPYVALADIDEILVIFALASIFGYVSHRIARATPLRRLAPNWVSWDAGNRFPMGYPLAVAFVAYLALAAAGR